MRLLLPTRLDVEINGFNGGLLADVPGGYEFYIGRYGVKWPSGYALEVANCGPDFLEVDFDTPWSPPDDCVFAALSEQFGVATEHWYAESGCNLCVYDTYSNGELTESLSSSLEWGEEDEDGYTSRHRAGLDYQQRRALRRLTGGGGGSPAGQRHERNDGT
ncbi:hypothetical protein C7431_111123 [Pantoea allii]|uniref:Uncharacterized protein n=1 Tax=Pantoea allii TaxID=574096 RepID=A0A2V2BFR6_9GAMM|nr:hypothetical protein C7431_111123 [Pantoea allii]